MSIFYAFFNLRNLLYLISRNEYGGNKTVKIALFLLDISINISKKSSTIR